MASEVQICNLAIARAGSKAFITSLSEASQEAQSCAIFYELLRDKGLERCWWPFATRWASLAALAVEHEQYEFVYALPAGCLSPRYLWTGIPNPPADRRIPFVVEAAADGSGRVLACSQADTVLVYTARISNPAAFSASFSNALGHELAAELTLPLSGKAELALARGKVAELEWSKAIAQALNEQCPHPAPAAEVIAER